MMGRWREVVPPVTPFTYGEEGAMEIQEDSRTCDVCEEAGRTRWMRGDRRHLHEMEPGDRVFFPVLQTVVTVEEIGAGRAVVDGVSSEEEVSFESQGREVSFTRHSSGRETVSPVMEVMPV